MATAQRPKKEPVYGIVSQYPMYLYCTDGATKLCGSAAEVQALLAQNVDGKPPKWAHSPAAFGVETAPAADEQAKASEARWR